MTPLVPNNPHPTENDGAEDSQQPQLQPEPEPQLEPQPELELEPQPELELEPQPELELEPQPELELQSQQQAPQQPRRPPPQWQGFLQLPIEVRDNIYRRLLVNFEPIQDLNQMCRPRPRDLHPQILATCSAVRDEGRVVLYSVNVMRLKISDFVRLFNQVLEWPCHHRAKSMDDATRRRLLLTKSFEIDYFDIPAAKNFWELSKTACRLMSQLDGIRYLSLQIDYLGFSVFQVLVILSGWALLRNMPCFVLTGDFFRANEEMSLKSLFWTNRATRHSPVPRMYYALEKFAASPFYCCECLLRQAEDAAIKDDFVKFKKCRAFILRQVHDRMKEVKDLVKQHDPDGDFYLPRLEKPRSLAGWS